MRGLATAVAFLALLLCACSGGDDTEPTSGSSPTPSSTPVEEVTPTPVPTTPTPIPTPAEPMGPVIVTLSGNPQQSLLAYDLRAGGVLLDIDLPVGNVASYTGDARSGRILVANDTTVSEVPLDGSPLQELFAVTDEEYRVADVAIAPDGALAAVAVQRWPRPEVTPTPDDGEYVAFIDLATGDEVSRVTRPLAPPPGSPFEAFRGLFNWLSWRDDGTGVVVSGATFSEGPGSWATIFTDGRVVRHDLVDYAKLAPSGRLATHGENLQFACLAAGTEQIAIRDLDTGVDVAFAGAPEGSVFIARDWSPDSAQVLLSQLTVVPFGDGVCLDQSSGPDLVLFDVESGVTEPVDDLAALYARWSAGEPAVTMQCSDGSTAFLSYSTWAERYVSCDEPPGTKDPLLVDGKQIAEGDRFQVIGITDVGP